MEDKEALERFANLIDGGYILAVNPMNPAEIATVQPKMAESIRRTVAKAEEMES